MDSVQFTDANGIAYASAQDPLPVIVTTPVGDQPAVWEWSDISEATPLPVTATITP